MEVENISIIVEVRIFQTMSEKSRNLTLQPICQTQSGIFGSNLIFQTVSEKSFHGANKDRILASD